MIKSLLKSLERHDSVVGDRSIKYRCKIKYLLDTWHWGDIAIPSGKSIIQMDQTLIQGLKQIGHPGLVLFSSGSSGEPKAALHDVTLLLEKFKEPKTPKKMLFFMQLDHIGGINTMLHSLSSQGTLVTVADRNPETVAEAIETHKVQVLPTTPTFLNLLLLSGACNKHNLSSLELITYGTEPMPESTLAAIYRRLPWVKFKQTYGLSELGIAPTKSLANDSLWMNIGSRDYQMRVVDGMLEIMSQSAMMGYLNAPNPFTDDGWFKTGDAVAVDGDWIKILGRRSEMINVGGEKVFPAEVESILQAMDGVESAIVRGEPNDLMGQLINATVKLSTNETAQDFRKRMRMGWKDARYKMPIKVELGEGDQVTERFKRNRNA